MVIAPAWRNPGASPCEGRLAADGIGRAARAEEVTVELDVTPPVRPLLRGRLHQLAAVASVAGLVWLVRSAHTPRAQVAVAPDV